jgi:hypothetical protein
MGEHVARMGKKRNAYRILVGKPEGNRPLGRPRRSRVDNIKMDLVMLVKPILIIFDRMLSIVFVMAFMAYVPCNWILRVGSVRCHPFCWRSIYFICSELPSVYVSILTTRRFRDQFPVVSNGKSGYEQFSSNYETCIASYRILCRKCEICFVFPFFSKILSSHLY